MSVLEVHSEVYNNVKVVVHYDRVKRLYECYGYANGTCFYNTTGASIEIALLRIKRQIQELPFVDNSDS